MANVSIWRSWTHGSAGGFFGDRERRLLELLFPSLQAGIEALLQWQQHRIDLLQAVDALGQAVLVCDQDGSVLHETAALTAALSADLEGEAVRAALLRMARAHRIDSGTPVFVSSPAVAEIRTARARYRLRATAYGTPRERQPLILVALELLTPPPPSEDEARGRFGLTPSEARVAFLLAQGCSNKEVAEALGIRESTARRHTEHVLAKLNVRARAAVGPRLLNDAM
jgi:DNA-binding NarL/FixJ family response regulator